MGERGGNNEKLGTGHGDPAAFVAMMDSYHKDYIQSSKRLKIPNGDMTTIEFQNNILECLEVLSEFYEAACAYVVCYDQKFNMALNAHEWSRDDCRASFPHAQYIDLDLYPYLATGMGGVESVVCDVSALKAKWPSDYAILAENDVRSLMTCLVPFDSDISARIIVENPDKYEGVTGFLHYASVFVGINLLLNEERLKLDTVTGDYELRENDVVFNMLGTFEVITQKGKLSGEDIVSDQCGKLLLCLLRNRDRRHSIDDIFEMLWPDRIADNPYDSVKSIVYRTRRQLEPICDKPVILATRGTFIINPEINPILDSEIFINVCQRANNKGLSREERLEACYKALDLYRGELMSGFDITEHWLMTRRTRYRLSYTDVMRNLLELLAEEGRFTEMTDIVSAAQGFVFSDPSIQWFLITAFLDNKRYDLAQNHYLVAEKLLTDDQKTYFRNRWEKRL